MFTRGKRGSLMFWVWRFLFQFKWAKSGSWETTDIDSKRIYMLSFHLIESYESGNRAFCMIAGPISLIVGYAKKE